MPVSLYPESRSVWFGKSNPAGGADSQICTIWDDGEVILESSEGCEYMYPTLEEWKFLAKVVNTNIERIRKESNGN